MIYHTSKTRILKLWNLTASPSSECDYDTVSQVENFTFSI